MLILIKLSFHPYVPSMLCCVGQSSEYFITFQYRNASNPLAHYDGTAEEILDACDGMKNRDYCSSFMIRWSLKKLSAVC